MTEAQKEQLLTEAKTNLKNVIASINSRLNDTNNLVKELPNKIRNAPTSELLEMYVVQLGQQKEIVSGLESISTSPYFVRCTVQFSDKDEPTDLYFGKFTHSSESIFSWITPAATMRFEDIGEFHYLSPSGKRIDAEMLRKDQFMIVNGEIIYMTNESYKSARQLIHQEYMPSHKTGFVLPEIVEQMEKSQDQVIRASHYGSFLISGPAGSGKTTLALHRVAYLVQSPDTQKLFPGESIIVFVQDSSSKEYFSSLLPSLGIKDVQITTFDEWAINTLNLNQYKPVRRYGDNEEERDLLEFYKNIVLKNAFLGNIKLGKYPLEDLEEIYSELLPENLMEVIRKQFKEKKLDRFDLTILLKVIIETEGKLKQEKVIIGNRKIKGIYQRIKVKDPIEYSLIIIDETQNYLMEQIQIIKTLSKQRTNSLLYVGDLAQQTQLSTLRNWEEINEIFEEERKVVLNKVYRNTKQILEFINNLGYQITIPQGIKEGPEVTELIINALPEEVNYIENILQNKNDKVIGIITKTPEHRNELRNKINDDKVHFMTINEAQGVEFDIVILSGINMEDFCFKSTKIPEALRIEKTRINKDLIYVALTRAMDELHIIGREKLSNILINL